MAKDLAQIYIRAKDETGGAFDSVKRGAAGVGDALGRVNGALAGLGAGLSVGAFALLVKNSIDAQAALDDLADTTALTVETLSSLQQTAKIGGHSFEQVTGTATKFAKSVAEAAGGNKELLRSFDALGISQERLRTSKFDDLYVEFAKKIATAENKTYAIAYATDLAGKSAAQALPFFKDLAETGLEQARVTAQQAEAAEKLQKEIGKLRNEFDGFSNKVASVAVPVMLQWIENVKTAYAATGNLATALAALANLGQFGDTAAAQIRKIDEELEKVKRNQGIFDGWLAQPLLGMRESGLLNARSVAVANRGPEALRWAAGLGDISDANDRRMASSGRFALPPPPSAPGTPDTAGLALISQLQGQLGELNGQGSVVEQTIRKLTDGTKQYTLEVQASALAIAGEIDEKKRQIALNKEQTADAERQIKAQEAWDDILAQFNQTHSEYRQGLEFETSLLGKTDTEREVAIALRKIELDFLKQSTNANAEQYEQLKKIYDLERERLPGAVIANESAKKAIEANKKLVEDIKRQNEQITQSLTDALMRGFENGKGFAENFRAALKNMFSTLILRPIIQPIAQGAAGAITGALGGMGIPGYANAAGGGGGLGDMFSMASSANSLMGGGIGAGLFSGAGAYSTALGLSSSAAGSQAALLAAQTGQFGLSGLAGTASSAGAAGASAMMTALPYIGLAIAAYSLIKAGSNKGGPASFTGLDVSGAVTQQGVNDYEVFGNSANSKQAFRWSVPGLYVDAPDKISAIVKGLVADLSKAGGAFGLDTSRLSSYSVPFNLRAQPSSGPHASTDDIMRAFLANLGGVSDQLATQLMPNLRQFAQANETATQTLVRLVQVQEQLRAAEAQQKSQIADVVRGLPGQLGITSLQGARDALAVSEYQSPMDRMAAARAQMEATYQRGLGGDLTAVSGYGGVLQQALSIGREVGASGPAFQSLFMEGNRQLNELLARQQALQTDMLKNVDLSILQSSQDQVAELRKVIDTLVDGFNGVQAELRRLREAA